MRSCITASAPSPGRVNVGCDGINRGPLWAPTHHYYFRCMVVASEASTTLSMLTSLAFLAIRLIHDSNTHTCPCRQLCVLCYVFLLLYTCVTCPVSLACILSLCLFTLVFSSGVSRTQRTPASRRLLSGALDSLLGFCESLLFTPADHMSLFMASPVCSFDFSSIDHRPGCDKRSQDHPCLVLVVPVLAFAVPASPVRACGKQV